MFKQCLAGLTFGLLVSACETTPIAESYALPALKSSPLCETAQASLSIEHATARVNGCTTSADNEFDLTITPENTPINDSPWYGFRIDPKTSGELRINLNYIDGKHRYKPKISYDGTNWNRVPENRVSKIGDHKALLRLETDHRSFFISAQEIFTKEAHNNWTSDMAKSSFASQSEIGRSIDGNPINMLTVQTNPSSKKPYLMLVGRQHPPELTGALALIPFSETVLSDTLLAKRFRDYFDILIVPNLNPDGVTAGNWRHNKNGKDLNRDWGPFEQPETQAIDRVLQRFETGNDRIAFFLDFHSTSRNLFYTQADDELTSPPDFARDWLRNADKKIDDNIYDYSREARHNSGRPTSKNYMYEKFGIAAITYEVGDHTDRGAIDMSARVFANEMMELLLIHETKQ